MNKEKDSAFDDLFKNGLGDPIDGARYQEGDWDALEKMLDKPAKRPGIVFWLPVLSSAAAALLFLGWWFFKQPVTPKHQQQQQVAALTGSHRNDDRKHIIGEDGLKNRADGSKKELSPGSVHQSNTQIKSTTPVKDEQAGQLLTKSYIAKNSFGVKPAVQPMVVAGKGIEKNNEPIAQIDQHREDVMLAAVDLGVHNDDRLLNDGSNVIAHELVNTYKPQLPKEDKDVTKLGFVKHPQLALSFIGAPEVNTVSSVGGAKSGTNFGVVFSAGIFKKLTVSTGASYTSKPYNTDIANYHTAYAFKTSPSEIEADCRMLDIPINLDYQLYNKHKNKFSIGTGLSSYIMLHESYDYYYADPSAIGPTNYQVKKDGKYFFGVVNVQATYQRQVNSKFGISIQPYMKLPIANIGYSQVRLQTAGVAVGLNWNLNSLTKP